ncbi:MAG TPA: hypothetical protein GXZ61_03210 [Clostridiales bacterium]|jgi:ABC-2 type transport system permease protein|nr:hypothetical protein [Clostridiales bacterium]
MLKALLKVRLAYLWASMFRSSTKTKTSKSSLSKVGLALLVLYGFGTLAFVFGAMYSAILEPFHKAGIDWLYFLLAGLFSAGIMFISSIFTAQTQLFESKDNDLLLSLPVPPSYLLLSRIFILFVIGFFLHIIVFVPSLVVYLMKYSLSVSQLICYFVIFLALPFFSLAFASLCGWLLAAITSRMRSRTLFTMIMSLLFFAVYFYINAQVQSYIQYITSQGEAIAEAIQGSIFPLFWLGSAIAEGNFLYLLLIVLFCVVPFALVYYIILKNFIKIATTKSGSAQIAYVERAFKLRSAKHALLRKELSRYTSSAMYMLNSSLGLLFGIIGAVFLAIKADDLLRIASKMAIDELYIGVIAAVALCGLSTMNLISAPSISLEGKSLWIPQSLPVPARDVLLAKAKLQMVISIPAMLITQIIIAFALQLPLEYNFVLFALPLVFTVFAAFFGLYINLMFPKFDWVSETVAVKQSASILLTMLGLTVAVVIPIVLYVFVLDKHMDIFTYTLLFTAIFGIASLMLYRYIDGRGAKRFEGLQ